MSSHLKLEIRQICFEADKGNQDPVLRHPLWWYSGPFLLEENTDRVVQTNYLSDLNHKSSLVSVLRSDNDTKIETQEEPLYLCGASGV